LFSSDCSSGSCPSTINTTVTPGQPFGTLVGPFPRCQ
jgi:hypothetical protein